MYIENYKPAKLGVLCNSCAKKHELCEKCGSSIAVITRPYNNKPCKSCGDFHKWCESCTDDNNMPCLQIAVAVCCLCENIE